MQQKITRNDEKILQKNNFTQRVIIVCAFIKEYGLYPYFLTHSDKKLARIRNKR